MDTYTLLKLYQDTRNAQEFFNDLQRENKQIAHFLFEALNKNEFFEYGGKLCKQYADGNDFYLITSTPIKTTTPAIDSTVLIYYKIASDLINSQYTSGIHNVRYVDPEINDVFINLCHKYGFGIKTDSYCTSIDGAYSLARLKQDYKNLVLHLQETTSVTTQDIKHTNINVNGSNNVAVQADAINSTQITTITVNETDRLFTFLQSKIETLETELNLNAELLQAIKNKDDSKLKSICEFIINTGTVGFKLLASNPDILEIFHRIIQ